MFEQYVKLQEAQDFLKLVGNAKKLWPERGVAKRFGITVKELRGRIEQAKRIVEQDMYQEKDTRGVRTWVNMRVPVYKASMVRGG